jgi:hypothetical protein
MPLKSQRELMEEPNSQKPPIPNQITYLVPDTEPVFTVDDLAALVRQCPEFGRPGEFAFYEVERLALGNGHVMITAETFRFADDAA